MNSQNENLVTVQGVMTPVPAALGSARAGYQSSISNGCNVTSVSLAKVTDNATSNNQNPFTKSGIMKRTPPSTGSSSVVPLRANTESVTVECAANTEKTADAFSNLGDKISELQEMMSGGRRSIHQPMRDLVALISSLYQRAASDKAPVQKEKTNDRSTQTTHLQQMVLTSKRTREEKESVRKTPPKKSKSNRPGGRDNPVSKDPNGVLKERADIAPLEETNRAKGELFKPNEESQPNDWVTKVSRRRRPRKPDVVIIKPTEKLSFADILRKVRAAPELKSVGEDVHSVKKTQRGEILLEFRRSAEVTTESHRAKIKSILAEDVVVKSITEEATFELRYLDEITTEDEIITAWSEQIGEIHPSAIRTIRSVPGGSRTAIIVIPARLAHRAEEVAKLRVGWSVCRLLRKVNPRRCYKCLDFGHVARNCRSGRDWSRSCFKCGGQDHLAKACQCDPHCLPCRENQDVDAKHVTGGPKCPNYLLARRKLLSQRR